MIPLWSAQQHAWLEALGHEVLVQGALPEIQVPAAVAPRSNMRGSVTHRSVPAPGRTSRPVPPPRREDLAAPAAQPRKTAAGLPDRLHFALVRASGCNPNAPDAAQMMAQWPAAAQLRGNPEAKRALWPRLRALRKHALP